jgi:hypothetical protein
MPPHISRGGGGDGFDDLIGFNLHKRAHDSILQRAIERKEKRGD